MSEIKDKYQIIFDIYIIEKFFINSVIEQIEIILNRYSQSLNIKDYELDYAEENNQISLDIFTDNNLENLEDYCSLIVNKLLIIEYISEIEYSLSKHSQYDKLCSPAFNNNQEKVDKLNEEKTEEKNKNFSKLFHKSSKNTKEKIKPLLFLDIDGVINLFDYPNEPYNKYPFNNDEGFIVCHKNINNYLATLSQISEIVWCSYHEENSNLLSKAFNLNQFDHVPLDKIYITDNHWKIESVKIYLTKNLMFDNKRPFIWIDDEFKPKDFIWIKSLPMPSLLVKTDPMVGITDKDMKNITKWINKL